MQPYFFPYIGYWQLMNGVDKYVIYDDVNFIRRGWINRNRILMNGEPMLINLIMSGASSSKLINEVKVEKDEKHKHKLLKTIERCYKKAPNYEDTYHLIEDIISNDEEDLSLYLEYLMKKIAQYLEIKTEFILSSHIAKDNSLKGEDKIIEICKILNASEYFNAIGGVDLYSREVFNLNEIKLNFLQTELVEYNQFGNKFVPNLSIIDVMMFNSKDSVKQMLNCYSLS